MLYTPDQDSLVGSSKMVTNSELAKKVEEQEELYQRESRELKGMLAELTNKLEHIKTMVEKKETKEEELEEVSVDDESEISEFEKPFLKALKALGGKSTELPTLIGKMDTEVVLEWIEALENHFECEKIT